MTGNQSPKRRATIFSRIFLSVLIPELIVFTTLGILSYRHIVGLIAENESLQVKGIQEEVVSLSAITNAHIDMLSENLEEIMQVASFRIFDAYRSGRLDLRTKDMKELLVELNIDTSHNDIYIIEDGEVINTSFPKDMGLDLYAFGADFKNKLKGAMETGEFVVDPVIIDAETHTLKRYSYMATHDRRYLIEFGLSSADTRHIHNMVKIRLEEMIARNPNVVEVNHIFGQTPGRFENAAKGYVLGEPLHYYYFEPTVRSDSTILQYAMYLGRDTAYSINDSLDAYYAYFPNPGQILRVVYNNTYGKDAAAAEWRRSGLIFGVAMLILFGMVLMNSRIIAKPISNLLAGAKSVGKGELGTRVPLTGTKETASLARQFNFMARNLEKSRDKLTRQKNKIEKQAEELAEKNEKLIELDQFKESMTSMIVHDLKNPLNAIVNSDPTSDMQRQNRDMRRSGKMMLNMVLDILDVSKYQDSKMTLSLGSRSLAIMINEAIDQVQFLADRRGIELASSVEAKLAAHADGEVLERMLVNLLTNAIKFSPIKGKITLSASTIDDTMVRVEVADEGPGIPEEKREAVFARFGQAEERKSGDVKSTGLGLAFCKMAAEAHGGEIGVDSVVGEGSQFWFTLTKSDEQGIPMPQEEQVEADADANTMQLTEDDMDYLRPIAHELKELPIYKVSQFRKVLKSIDRKNESVNRWKVELEHAFDTADQDRFHQYLNMVLNGS